MKNYEAPKIEVFELEVEDIIQTSGGENLNPGGNTQIPGTGVVVPIPGGNSLDNEY